MDFIEPQRHLDQLIAWSLSHRDIRHFPIVPFTPLNQPQPMTTTTTGTKLAMVGTGENPTSSKRGKGPAKAGQQHRVKSTSARATDGDRRASGVSEARAVVHPRPKPSSSKAAETSAGCHEAASTSSGMTERTPADSESEFVAESCSCFSCSQ